MDKSEEKRLKRNEYMRKWRAAHPEYVEYQRKYLRRYYSEHREERREYSRTWNEANKDRKAKNAREWYLKNRGPLKGKLEGPKHPNWKGDKSKYLAHHTWVARHLGKPTICAHCGKEGTRLHWANVDHQYRRVLTDWIRLCAACHYRYDVEHGLQPKLDSRLGGIASQKARAKGKSKG